MKRSALACLLLAACGESRTQLPISSIVVEPSHTTINAGGTAQFHASARDTEGHPIDNADFTWSSSDDAVATVDRSGLADGHIAGTATITAVSGGAEGRALLIVQAEGQPQSGDFALD